MQCSLSPSKSSNSKLFITETTNYQEVSRTTWTVIIYSKLFIENRHQKSTLTGKTKCYNSSYQNKTYTGIFKKSFLKNWDDFKQHKIGREKVRENGKLHIAWEQSVPVMYKSVWSGKYTGGLWLPVSVWLSYGILQSLLAFPMYVNCLGACCKPS